MKQAPQHGNSKLIAQVIIFVLVFCLAFFGTKFLFKKDVAGELQKAVTEINKKCPVIEGNTRLNSAEYLKPGTVLYIYTVLDLDISKLGEYSADKLRDSLQAIAQKKLDTSDENKIFRENNVTQLYIYKDKKNVDLLGFEINPKIK